MHALLLVKVLATPESTPDAVKAYAEEELYEYSGREFDFFDLDNEFTKCLIRKDGEKVQMCRAHELDRMEYEPYDMIMDEYLSSSTLERYGVNWSDVVDREIKMAQKEDDDDDPVWFVMTDIHI